MEVGRDRIISRLLSVLRSEDDIDLSRKTLAEMAEVTPALISYDLYTTVMKKTGRSGNAAYCELAQMTEMLTLFFSSWRGRPVKGDFDAAVLQGAVWGMCRFAARVEADETGLESDVTPLVARVVKLLSSSGMTLNL